MSRTLAVGALVLSLAGANAALAQPMPPGPPPAMQAQTTPGFLTAAGQSDQFEIQEGRLASRRSMDPLVRRAAMRMIHDHTDSTNKLMMAAHEAGMPPMAPPPLAMDQQQMFERLQATTGPAFDRLYVNQQVTAHEKALALMTSYVQSAPAGPIRHAAGEIRPTVQAHLTMWEKMQTMH